MFGNIMGKLAGHPKFAQWVSDPVMMQKINLLQSNPQMGIQMCMSDPAMGEVLEAALGIKLGTPDSMGMNGGGGAGGAAPMDTEPTSSSASALQSWQLSVLRQRLVRVRILSRPHARRRLPSSSRLRVSSSKWKRHCHIRAREAA